MADTLDNLIDHIAGEISQRIEMRMRGTIEKLARENTKFVYSEEEAAAWLGDLSVETLQNWRRRGLVEYARYPLAKVRNGHADDDLGSTYTYSLDALKAFRDKYLVPAAGASAKNVLKMRKSA